MNELWSQLARRAEISWDERQDQLLERYLQLLLAANERMNLTRIVDPEAAKVLHGGDSMTLLPHLPKRAHQLADVGSGGGVPGMVLAIARPDAKVFLVEATLKKADFLSLTAKELGLENVTVLPMRAEDVARKTAGGGAMREAF